MKWTYFIKQKMRVALLLFCIMASGLLVAFLVDKSVQHIYTSFLSLYEDRLVPSSDLFHMADYLHKRKYTLMDFVDRPNPSVEAISEMENRLQLYHQQIDTLVKKFEQTYLVLNEQDLLSNFKALLAACRKEEEAYIATVLSWTRDGATRIRRPRALHALDKALEEVVALEKIQTQVGREITTDVQDMVKETQVFYFFQIILSVIIGTMILALVMTSKSVIQRKQEPFRLN